MAEQPHFSKEKEIILKLIQVYKEMPYLWDKQHKNYRNKNVRKEGNKVLLELYKELDSNATLKTLTKKVQNLRTGYFKELKRVRELNRPGASDEVYVPTLYYFGAMSFLESICESYPDTVKTEDNSTSSSDTESVPRSVPTPTFPQKKKRLTKSNSLQKHESPVNTIGEVLHMKDEEWEIIGKGIGLQLKDLNLKQFYIAQKIIHDTLYYAQMGLLTEHSCVTGLEQLMVSVDPLNNQ